jgi:hypothetical protein
MPSAPGARGAADSLVTQSIRRQFLDHVDPKRLESVAEAFAAIADSKMPGRWRP